MLRSSEVNSAFSSRDQAIRRFFISDGLHLATQGTSLFVANIKCWLRKTLHIRFENFQRNQSVQNYRHTHNHPTESTSKSGRLIDRSNYMCDSSFGGENTQSRRRQYTNRYMYKKPMSRYDRNWDKLLFKYKIVLNVNMPLTQWHFIFKYLEVLKCMLI